MLFLDVTNSCKSPLNTGVQRVVRGLYAALAGRVEVTPLIWSNGWNCYCRLSAREQRYLCAPFDDRQKPSARPEDAGGPVIWAKGRRFLRQRRSRLRLEEFATADDVLLVPEIFQDRRMQRLGDAGRWFAGRCYAVFHDAAPLRLPEMSKPRERVTFPRYVGALAGFRGVICPSRETEQDLRSSWKSSGLGGGETLVRPWPTDFGRARETAPPGFGERRVLCVASLHRRKNHLALLAAAGMLWDEGQKFELALIGRTTAYWGRTVTAEIDRLRRAGRPVEWLRHVDDEWLHRAYRACSFTVYPSVHEGFGLPILESLWHCRPCVCGGNGALGEAAAGGGCLFVDQRDPASLAAGMRRLLTDRGEYDRLYEEAGARRFSGWDEYREQLVKDLGLG